MTSLVSGITPAELVAGLFYFTPPGTNPFEFVQASLDATVQAPRSGPYRVQAFVFIPLHFVVAILAFSACGIRYWKGGFWLFQKRNGLICPNTTFLTILLFGLHATAFNVIFIVRAFHKTADTPAYFFEILVFIPIALAFHFQSWATLSARPRGSVNPEGFLRFGSRLPTPTRARLVNGFMIILGILVPLSFIGGRLAAVPSSLALMAAYDRATIILERAKAHNANVQETIPALIPDISIYISESLRLARVTLISVKCYSVWPVVWLVTYVPSVVALLTTLHRQERHLRQTHDNLEALDAVVTFAPDMMATPPVGARPSTAGSGQGRNRTAAQREEVGDKLLAIHRLQVVILTQLATTIYMILGLGSFLIYILATGFGNVTSERIQILIIGWTSLVFLPPGLAFSAYSVHTALRAPSHRSKREDSSVSRRPRTISGRTVPTTELELNSNSRRTSASSIKSPGTAFTGASPPDGDWMSNVGKSSWGSKS